MKRLMHAEWFRIVHSGFLVCIIFIVVLFPVVCSFSNPDWKYQTLSENFTAWATSISVFMPLAVGSIICALITMAYQNRTSYHEIMDGHSIHEILLSKVVLYSTMMTCGIAAIFTIYTGIIAVNSGVGEMYNIPLRMFLFVIVTIHICIISTLISTIVSIVTTSGIFSFVFLILRFFMVDCIAYVMAVSNPYYYSSLSNWFIMGQFSEIFTGNVNADLVLGVILSLEIESIMWYICAYLALKRKAFK